MDRWGLILRTYGPAFAGAAAVALAIVAAGVGGYQIAASKAVDVDAIQSAAARAGESRGHARAAHEAYSRGFKATRERAFRAAYREAYESAYRAEFAHAGLATPKVVKVSGP